MDKFVIDGPARLEGEVAISGAKNAALPCLAATLLTAAPVRLNEPPHVGRRAARAELLAHIGAVLEADADSRDDRSRESRQRRRPLRSRQDDAGVGARLGPLLARAGSVRFRFRGIARSGVRPIDFHPRRVPQVRSGVTSTTIRRSEARAGLRGADVAFETITVTGHVERDARGDARLRHDAARERRAGAGVVDLARLLVAIGRADRRSGHRTITIEESKRWHGAEPRWCPTVSRRHYAICGRGDEGRRRGPTLVAVAPEGADDPADGDRGGGRSRSRRAPRPGQRGARGAGRRHRGVSRLSDGPPGAVDGARHRPGGGLHDHRDDLREPLPSRRRARSDGREHPARRKVGRR